MHLTEPLTYSFSSIKHDVVSLNARLKTITGCIISGKQS